MARLSVPDPHAAFILGLGCPISLRFPAQVRGGEEEKIEQKQEDSDHEGWVCQRTASVCWCGYLDHRERVVERHDVQFSGVTSSAPRVVAGRYRRPNFTTVSHHVTSILSRSLLRCASAITGTLSFPDAYRLHNTKKQLTIIVQHASQRLQSLGHLYTLWGSNERKAQG